MRISDQFILRQIAGEYIIIPTGQTTLKFNGMITVNEQGAFLWEALKEEITEDALVDAVLAELRFESRAQAVAVGEDGVERHRCREIGIHIAVGDRQVGNVGGGIDAGMQIVDFQWSDRVGIDQPGDVGGG